MPDGDIFSDHVFGPWGKPSRLVFGAGDDEVAIDACTRVLADELNNRPWNGFPDAVRIIETAESAELTPEYRREFLASLRQISVQWTDVHRDAMLREANRILAEPKPTSLRVFPSIGSTVRQDQVAARILAQFVLMQIAPAGRVARLAREGKMTEAVFANRAFGFRRTLGQAPNLLKIASQILRNEASNHQSIKVPRTRTSRLSQADLLGLPIG